MQAMDSKAQREVSTEAGAADARRWPRMWLAIVAAMAMLLGAYWLQDRQLPCGDPHVTAPSWQEPAFWGCPYEVNPHGRPTVPAGTLTLSGLWFDADGQRGWAVGASGTVLATRDAGRSWQPQPSMQRSALHGVRFAADGLRGWAVGGGGTVIATRDGGHSWQSQPVDTQAELQSVAFSADGQRGWVVGSGGTVLATLDSGQSWVVQALRQGRSSPNAQQQQAPVDAGQARLTSAWLQGVAASADGQRVWAVGSENTVLSTRNGGQTWQVQRAARKEEAGVVGSDGQRSMPAWLHDVVFSTDGQRGVAVGWDGTVLATRDGGQSWEAQASATQVNLHGVAFSADGQRGWAVGRDGVVIATRDGGRNWRPQTSGTRANLLGVVFHPDGLRGWAAGEGGTLIATRDGGQRWQAQGPYLRYPAPWFALLVVLLLAGAVAGAVWQIRQPATRRHERMVSKALADEPISRAEQDRLGFTPIVEGLAAYLRHEKTRAPVVLAVTAPWGRGKSSLMRMLRTQLERHGLPIVWFNAWHHQKEPVLMAALLSAVVQQSVPSWFSLRGLRFRSRLVWRRWWRRPLLGALPGLLWFGALLALAVSALAAVVAAFGGTGPSGVNPVFQWWASGVHARLGWLTGNKAVESLSAGEWSRFARELLGTVEQDPAKLLPFLSVLVAIATVFFLLTYYSRAFPASPSALLASLGSKFSLTQAEAQTGFRDRFREHFRDVTEALQPRTLTVFIDDLDRCEAHNSAEVLEAVNFLTDSGQCFVVLGISRDIVEAQLGDAYGTLAQRTAEFEQVRAQAAARTEAHVQTETGASPESSAALAAARVRLHYARNYLRKLIQIEVPVPAFGAVQARGMVDDEARHGSLVTAEQRKRLAVERRWQRCFDAKAAAMSLLGLLLPAAIALWLGLQAQSWGVDQEKSFESERSRMHEEARGARESLATARRYAAYLRLESARALQHRDAAASSGEDAVLALAERQAHLASVEALLGEGERLVQRLNAEVDERKPKAAQLSGSKVRAQARELQTVQEHDALYQTRLAEQLSKTQVILPAMGPLPTEPPQGGAAATAAAGAEAPRPTWPVVLPLLVLLLLLGAVLARTRREQIVESEDYRDASRRWSPVLASVPGQQAPREMVRFFNLSRYLALRLHPAAYVPVPWLKRWLRKRAGLAPLDVDQQQVPETAIVALTSLYLARPPAFRNGNARAFLESPLDALRTASTADEESLRAAIAAATQGEASQSPADALSWTPDDVAVFLAALGEIRVDEPTPMSGPGRGETA